MTNFLELSTMLRLEELVAVGDYFALNPRIETPGEPRPYVDLEVLRSWLRSTTGRGVRRARSAADLVRHGVESPRETLLRLIAVGAGLPEPVCGYELIDAFGQTIGWFDLAWPEWRTIAEYDGDQHRTSDSQYEKDIGRFDRASEADWRVIRVRKRGVFEERDETVRRIALALQRGGCRNPFPNRRRVLVRAPYQGRF